MLWQGTFFHAQERNLLFSKFCLKTRERERPSCSRSVGRLLNFPRKIIVGGLFWRAFFSCWLCRWEGGKRNITLRMEQERTNRKTDFCRLRLKQSFSSEEEKLDKKRQQQQKRSGKSLSYLTGWSRRWRWIEMRNEIWILAVGPGCGCGVVLLKGFVDESVARRRLQMHVMMVTLSVAQHLHRVSASVDGIQSGTGAGASSSSYHHSDHSSGIASISVRTADDGSSDRRSSGSASAGSTQFGDKRDYKGEDDQSDDHTQQHDRQQGPAFFGGFQFRRSIHH